MYRFFSTGLIQSGKGAIDNKCEMPDLSSVCYGKQPMNVSSSSEPQVFTETPGVLSFTLISLESLGPIPHIRQIPVLYADGAKVLRTVKGVITSFYYLKTLYSPHLLYALASLGILQSHR